MTTGRVRTHFVRTTTAMPVYRDQDEEFGEDSAAKPAGTVLFVAPGYGLRNLDGKKVQAVLFTIGETGEWFWMPKYDFDRVTEKFDATQWAGAPFLP